MGRRPKQPQPQPSVHSPQPPIFPSPPLRLGPREELCVAPGRLLWGFPVARPPAGGGDDPAQSSRTQIDPQTRPGLNSRPLAGPLATMARGAMSLRTRSALAHLAGHASPTLPRAIRLGPGPVPRLGKLRCQPGLVGLAPGSGSPLTNVSSNLLRIPLRGPPPHHGRIIPSRKVHPRPSVQLDPPRTSPSPRHERRHQRSRPAADSLS